jgi:transposase-like protein
LQLAQLCGLWRRQLRHRHSTGFGSAKGAENLGHAFTSAHQRREAIERINAGEAVAEVARTFAVDRATVYRLRP